jgi:hypothetical protein
MFVNKMSHGQMSNGHMSKSQLSDDQIALAKWPMAEPNGQKLNVFWPKRQKPNV